MNETLKRACIIGVAVLALGVLAFEALNMAKGDQMQVEHKIQMPAGFKSEKQAALDQQKGGGKEADSKDLGGPLGQ